MTKPTLRSEYKAFYGSLNSNLQDHNENNQNTNYLLANMNFNQTQYSPLMMPANIQYPNDHISCGLISKNSDSTRINLNQQNIPPGIVFETPQFPNLFAGSIPFTENNMGYIENLNQQSFGNTIPYFQNIGIVSEKF